ncbi:MAG: hypothetical protein V4568_10820 [Pseudomonadota bacterium]
MLKVFITIDTELWPISPGWPVVPLSSDKVDFSKELENSFYGITLTGDFGIPYQIANFNRYGLKATYFVESMFADVLGKDSLSRLVSLIQTGKQEVQLHMHTEWLGEISDPLLPPDSRQNISQYSEAEQTAIIKHGLSSLRECGAESVVAFRAGNFGASMLTLPALKNNGLSFDSSHNTCMLDTTCDMNALGQLIQPKLVDGIVVVPVSYYNDYPNHFRHAQLCACSFSELREALLWAWKDGWSSFVIVMHSFELVRYNRQPLGRIMPHPLHLSRFDKLCRFLSDHDDKFSTAHFRDLDPNAFASQGNAQCFRSSLARTLYRYGEQFIGGLV